jgi:hypothetical protein
VRVVHDLGKSHDEPGRVDRVRARFPGLARQEPRSPLLELALTRADGMAYLVETCPQREVPRAACVSCPDRTHAERVRLRDTDPAGGARAPEIGAAGARQRRQPGPGQDAVPAPLVRAAR